MVFGLDFGLNFTWWCLRVATIPKSEIKSRKTPDASIPKNSYNFMGQQQFHGITILTSNDRRTNNHSDISCPTCHRNYCYRKGQIQYIEERQRQPCTMKATRTHSKTSYGYCPGYNTNFPAFFQLVRGKISFSNIRVLHYPFLFVSAQIQIRHILNQKFLFATIVVLM